MWQWIKSNRPWIVLVGATVAAVAIVATLYEWKEQERCEDACHEQQLSNPSPAIVTHRPEHPNANGDARGNEDDEPSWSLRRFLYEANVADATIALFTIVLGVATWRLWHETKRIREDSRDALGVLERAYLHASVANESIASMLAVGDPKPPNRPWVVIILTNHGKTPAYILSGRLSLVFDDNAGDTSKDELVLGSTVVGAGKDTLPILQHVVGEFRQPEFEKFFRDGKKLRVWGQVTYADIWDNQYFEEFWSDYNVNLRRFELQRRGRKLKKEEHAS